MRKLIMSAIAVGATALVWGAAPANADNSTVWEQDFSAGTSDWYDYYGTINWDGDADQTATATGATPQPDGTYPIGPYTDFADYSPDAWPGNWVAELDVRLDPNWTVGTGFDYSVASNSIKTDGTTGFLRDFIFHVGVDEDGLWVFGDNNSYHKLYKSPDAENIPSSANQPEWFTLQQVFADDNGVLSVTMNVLDSEGTTVYSTTRSNAMDTMDHVAGPSYGWFPWLNVDGGVTIDNARLSVVVPTPGTKDDCKNGGFTSFGFDNQGQCVASITASENASK